MSESDISSAFEHYNVICHMLATSGWDALMSNERSDSTLSLAKVHALRLAVRILKHNYSQLVAD